MPLIPDSGYTPDVMFNATEFVCNPLYVTLWQDALLQQFRGVFQHTPPSLIAEVIVDIEHCVGYQIIVRHG